MQASSSSLSSSSSRTTRGALVGLGAAVALAAVYSAIRFCKGVRPLVKVVDPTVSVKDVMEGLIRDTKPYPQSIRVVDESRLDSFVIESHNGGTESKDQPFVTYTVLPHSMKTCESVGYGPADFQKRADRYLLWRDVASEGFRFLPVATSFIMLGAAAATPGAFAFP